MNAVEFIAQHLSNNSLKLFSFPGGTISPLYQACLSSSVPVIISRSEFGAAYMAIGASKASGQAQFVAVTSGPGATNLITAIAECYYDSVPVIFLCGQVSKANLLSAGLTRQSGFQQTPIVNIAAPITKFAYQALSGQLLSEAFTHAIEMALADRRGPCLLDMPIDVQKEESPVKKKSDEQAWWDAYNEYLKSDHWLKLRKKILKRDDFECRLCGSKNRLQVHHKQGTYDRLGDERDVDLTTLCFRCHEGITIMLRQRRIQWEKAGKNDEGEFNHISDEEPAKTVYSRPGLVWPKKWLESILK